MGDIKAAPPSGSAGPLPADEVATRFLERVREMRVFLVFTGDIVAEEGAFRMPTSHANRNKICFAAQPQGFLVCEEARRITGL